MSEKIKNLEISGDQKTPDILYLKLKCFLNFSAINKINKPKTPSPIAPNADIIAVNF